MEGFVLANAKPTLIKIAFDAKHEFYFDEYSFVEGTTFAILRRACVRNLSQR